MTFSKKTTENFLKQLQFDADFYDVNTKNELLQYAENFLDYCKMTINEDCDYRNDQNENGHYYCDLASERADSMVDIYYSIL